jgi:hypothetical protein
MLLGAALAVACVFVLCAEANAAFTQNPLGNGTSAGYGAHTSQGDLDGKYLQKFPYVQPSGEKTRFWVNVCCDTCPGACPNQCCVVFSGSYMYKDKNGVAGPAHPIPTQNSCNPCQKCKEIQIDQNIIPGSTTGYASSWQAPSSQVVVTIHAKCKCCYVNSQAATAADDKDLGPVEWPPEDQDDD